MTPLSPRARRAKVVLLTGATGLLGSALLSALLRQGHAVVAAVRGRDGRVARERVERILEGLHCPAEARGRLEVVEWSSGSPLPASSHRLDAVVHAAAAVKFQLARRELLAQNVAGTAILLRSLDRIAPDAEFHFVSTAYVCGVTEQRALEQLSARRPPRFRNEYEASKWQAEQEVAAICERAGRPFAIYRPAIIAGDARDGRAATFHGVYPLLRALDVIARRRTGGRSSGALAIRCHPKGTKNVVAADWVADCIAALLRRPPGGAVYHLTHGAPLQHAELAALLGRLFGLDGLEACCRPGGGSARRAAVLLDRSIGPFTSYLWGEPVFDRTRLERALGARATPPPVDTAYFARLLAFARAVNWSPRPFEDADSVPLLPQTRRNPACDI